MVENGKHASVRNVDEIEVLQVGRRAEERDGSERSPRVPDRDLEVRELVRNRLKPFETNASAAFDPNVADRQISEAPARRRYEEIHNGGRHECWRGDVEEKGFEVEGRFSG